MKLSVGIDIGSVSAKVAIIGDLGKRELFEKIVKEDPDFQLVKEGPSSLDTPILIMKYSRIHGRPLVKADQLLTKIENVFGKDAIGGIRVTGSGTKVLGKLLKVKVENEFKSIAKAVEALFPKVRTVFEIGGENSKFILLEQVDESGSLGIVDYQTNADCAAGTGSFIDQQASRLRYKIEDVGKVADEAGRGARIAGRCSVFAKSDMIHAQQKGFKPGEVLKGLCEAVARNFKGTITKGKTIQAPVLFIGGVAKNHAVVNALREICELSEEEFIAPECHSYLGSIGAALLEMESISRGEITFQESQRLADLESYIDQHKETFPRTKTLSMENVIELRDRVKPYQLPDKEVDAYLGIDVGSVSTNLVVIDDDGNLIKEIYLWTQARPIEVVDQGLKEIEKEIGDKIKIRGVGTTGSGRELIGEIIGADTINDEITAHKTGSTYISQKLLGEDVDTIFEIGGQDSKFISLDKGIVVDFTMNEACAAGTGSFLEEQAEKLGIQIKGEFAKLALSSVAPIRLGERCTVFMERDLTSFQNKGAKLEDLVAGLAYSIVQNYLNRVVKGRKIGNVIYFQGGTAYNDAVAAAFSQVLGKRIIVPPHNGVVGAIGVALLAKEKMDFTNQETGFRGYDLSKIDYTIREISCKGCGNYCDVQEFNVEGEKTYWGDKCSERFRKASKTDLKPVIPDLIKLRHQFLMEEYEKYQPIVSPGPVIGMPRAMYFYDRFPFWNRYFSELGLRVEISDETNKEISNDGLDLCVSEPCYPIQVSHGHVKNLLGKGIDYLFIPNTLNAENEDIKPKSHLCPWGQTLCFVIKHVPSFEGNKDRILCPTINFDMGSDYVKKELHEMALGLGCSKKDSDRALDCAYKSQYAFWNILKEQGREALKILGEKGREGIVLLGRPYNINDTGINMNVGKKLRDYYGVNVIPMDFLPIDGIKIHDITENMFWNYGKKILAASKFISNHPNLHIIYVTNFKCGPDSYIKHYITDASKKPYLTLQFDAHSNDAGMLTRCEAYLDSKGVLRNWKQKKSLVA